MTLLKPLWMQAASGDADISYSAQQDRAALLSAIFSREGVLDVDAGQLQVRQRAAGANFSVDIAAGRAAIVGDDISDQGTYVVTSTATENRTIPGAPASGSRTHRVVARVKDKLHNGTWTGYEWTIEVLPDTGSGTPAVPASAVPLARVAVAAGQSSVQTANITDDRSRASVGTPDRTGTFSLFPPYNASDVNRKTGWTVNPDGWVSLSGWCMWNAPNQVIPANTLTQITNTPLPATILGPGRIRDFVLSTFHGPIHGAIGADGHLKYRFQEATTLIQGVTWWSFDGCGYRL